MKDELDVYLSGLVACAQETAVWFDGTMPLKINDYLNPRASIHFST